jgi:phytoene synthase
VRVAAFPALIELVRRNDPDRFLTALFAPAVKRDALFTLYAFNHELARAREVASEPMLALIRLQWWREVVEGAVRRHEVATPLTEAIRNGLLDPGDLLALIDAREIEAEPWIETWDDFHRYILNGPGGLSVAAARLLNADEPDSFRSYGAAYGIAGVLRGIPALAASGRCLLPADLLAAQGLTPEAAIADPMQAGVHAVGQILVEEARALLARVRRTSLPKSAIAAALPAVLARRDLARWPAPAPPRGLGDRLAVTLAALRGRTG